MESLPQWRFNFSGDWQEKTLGEVCKLAQGKKLSDKKLPYLEVKYLRGLKEKIFQDSGNFILAGTKIILVDGENSGEIFIAPEDGYMGSTFRVLEISEDVDAEFIYYFIETKQKLYRSHKIGTAIPHLNKKLFFETPIFLPSLAEQKQIGEYFSQLDNTIFAQEKELENWRLVKRGLLQKIFSREYKFVDDAGNFYPDWQEKTLGEIAESLTYGLNAKAIKFDGVHKYLRITDIDEKSRQFIQENLVSPDGEVTEKYRAVEGDIFFARTGATVGKTYIYKESDGEIYHAGYLIRARIKKEFVPYFIYLQTLTKKYSDYIKLMCQRTGQPGVNAEEYSKFSLQIPCLEEQKQIADYFSELDNIILSAEKILKNLRLMKKGLLQKLFV